MIKYVEYSIFDSPSLALVNPVNCVGIMGKGLALKFSQRFPIIIKSYKQDCLYGNLQIGTLTWRNIPDEKGPEGRRVIINFPTKNHWKNKSELAYIEAGLIAFQNMALQSVSFPKLGCGLGGLNWNDVKPLMEKYLENLDMEVLIHV